MRKSKKNEPPRQWSLTLTAEPLKEEESYHQSVCRFSKEDYKLIRNQSLFGTPGERITELQLLLEEAKENSAPQLIMYNWKAEGGFRNTEVLDENVNDDLPLQWVNTFQTENAILSNEGKNQIRKATNWSNLLIDAREFQFSLTFNIIDKLLNYTIASEEYTNIKYMQSCRYRQHQENTLQIHSQVAKRSNGKISRLTTELSNVRRNSQRPLQVDRLRKTVPELGEYEIYTRPTQQNKKTNHDTASKPQKNEFTELKSRKVRSNSSLNILRQRFEILRIRPSQKKRQQPPLPKEGVTSSQSQRIYRKINRYHPYHMVGQNEQTIRDTSTRVISHSPAPSRFLSKDVRSQPSITLSLQVRILPEEKAQGTISSTISKIQRTGKTVSYMSNRGISQLVISCSESSGTQICIRTTWLPLQGISETEYGRSSVLKALVRLSTMSFSDESWSYLEKQWARQHLWDVNLLFNNLKRIRTQHELNEASICCPKDSHVTPNKDMNNFTENTILRMLCLASVFLLRNNVNTHLRGLTNNKETNKFFTTKYKTTKDKEENSACINLCKQSHTGNTLKQLPYAWEFRLYGINHRPAENSTCPYLLSDSI